MFDGLDFYVLDLAYTPNRLTYVASMRRSGAACAAVCSSTCELFLEAKPPAFLELDFEDGLDFA